MWKWFVPFTHILETISSKDTTMRLVERHDVRASFVLLLPLLAAIDGCGADISIGSDSGGWSEAGGTVITWGTGGTDNTASSSGTGMGGSGGAGGSGVACGMSSSTSTSTGSGGAAGSPVFVAVLDDTTGYVPYGQMEVCQYDQLRVMDPANSNTPVLQLSGLGLNDSTGVGRRIATSKSKKRLAVIDLNSVRVFDENLQTLVHIPGSFGWDPAVCPTEQAIFALNSDSGSIVKFDANGSFVGSKSGPHGMDLIVDEDRQVVWTAGKYLIRVAVDLSNEQQFHTFPWQGVSLDLDANGGVWVAEREFSATLEGTDQLVHFDLNGNIISGDTLPLPSAPLMVRVDRNSGRVWVVTQSALVYRDVDGQLETVHEVLNYVWYGVEPDPLDSSRVWVAGWTKQVFHIDTSGTAIESIAGGLVNQSQKWLAVMLRGP